MENIVQITSARARFRNRILGLEDKWVEKSFWKKKTKMSHLDCEVARLEQIFWITRVLPTVEKSSMRDNIVILSWTKLINDLGVVHPGPAQCSVVSLIAWLNICLCHTSLAGFSCGALKLTIAIWNRKVRNAPSPLTQLCRLKVNQK